MTKNLFLLFVLYFFVIQALFLGILTGDSLYYTLGGINAVAIFLIVFLYQVFTAEKSDISKAKKADQPPISATKHETPSHKVEQNIEPLEKELLMDPKPTKEPLNEKGGIQKVVQVVPVQKKRRRKSTSGQWWILLITLLIAIALHFIVSEFLTYWSPLVTLFIGCIAFCIIGKIFDVKGFSKARTLLTTWIYVLFLLLAAAYAGLYTTGKGEFVETYLPALWQISLPVITTEKSNVTDTNADSDQPFSSLNAGEYVYEGSGQLITGSR
ncbi:MAG: hypothetical protein LBD75_00310 [Candidatus Peribacteria bacterium]|jgi:predicted membrane protein|nr:hypothetical protein [Candidatus Peribacteria bacterium]